MRPAWPLKMFTGLTANIEITVQTFGPNDHSNVHGYVHTTFATYMMHILYRWPIANIPLTCQLCTLTPALDPLSIAPF